VLGVHLGHIGLGMPQDDLGRLQAIRLPKPGEYSAAEARIL